MHMLENLDLWLPFSEQCFGCRLNSSQQVLVDYFNNMQSTTITLGNYTVTLVLTALTAALANGANNFLGMTATYNDII